MGTAALFSSLVLLGLAGSLHCAGMCGPFVLALGWRRNDPRGAALRMALYVLGKCCAYALLALALALGAAALSGELVSEREHALHAARSLLAWLAGGALVLGGAHALGLRWSVGTRLAARLQAPFAALLRASRVLPPAGGAFALGAINGCLPCGLSWSAILFAASQGGVALVAGPLVFGLATAPSLVAVAAGGALVPVAWRPRLQRLAALAMIGFGLWTGWRGGVPFAVGGGNNLPPCCSSVHALEH
jgi:sulfite exporter TauE/SafE